jgi:hypothetical protein
MAADDLTLTLGDHRELARPPAPEEVLAAYRYLPGKRHLRHPHRAAGSWPHACATSARSTPALRLEDEFGSARFGATDD